MPLTSQLPKIVHSILDKSTSRFQALMVVQNGVYCFYPILLYQFLYVDWTRNPSLALSTADITSLSILKSVIQIDIPTPRSSIIDFSSFGDSFQNFLSLDLANIWARLGTDWISNRHNLNLELWTAFHLWVIVFQYLWFSTNFLQYSKIVSKPAKYLTRFTKHQELNTYKWVFLFYKLSVLRR